jgi:hypothetical protein
MPPCPVQDGAERRILLQNTAQMYKNCKKIWGKYVKNHPMRLSTPAKGLLDGL